MGPAIRGDGQSDPLAGAVDHAASEDRAGSFPAILLKQASGAHDVPGAP